VSAPARRAVLALGSNLGDRLAMLQGAVDDLAAAARIVAVSPVVETDPVGGPEQDDYLNAVVVLQTSLTARELLDLAHRVEDSHGRVRHQRWGPRTLDVDVIAMGGERVDDPDLTVPHPRAAERGFVLVPWSLADPEAVLPGAGRVAELIGGLDVRGVRLRPDLALRAAVGKDS
jgi:2-amino-4-hydroxy-6-hydroxymethyldihydropteridine diphosphokinase